MEDARHPADIEATAHTRKAITTLEAKIAAGIATEQQAAARARLQEALSHAEKVRQWDLRATRLLMAAHESLEDDCSRSCDHRQPYRWTEVGDTANASDALERKRSERRQPEDEQAIRLAEEAKARLEAKMTEDNPFPVSAREKAAHMLLVEALAVPREGNADFDAAFYGRAHDAHLLLHSQYNEENRPPAYKEDAALCHQAEILWNTKADRFKDEMREDEFLDLVRQSAAAEEQKQRDKSREI